MYPGVRVNFEGYVYILYIIIYLQTHEYII
jgi:hypothetical protein